MSSLLLLDLPRLLAWLTARVLCHKQMKGRKNGHTNVLHIGLGSIHMKARLRRADATLKESPFSHLLRGPKDPTDHLKSRFGLAKASILDSLIQKKKR